MPVYPSFPSLKNSPTRPPTPATLHAGAHTHVLKLSLSDWQVHMNHPSAFPNTLVTKEKSLLTSRIFVARFVSNKPGLRRVAYPPPIGCPREYHQRTWRMVFQPLTPSFRRLQKRQPQLQCHANTRHPQRLSQNIKAIRVRGACDDPVGPHSFLAESCEKRFRCGIQVIVCLQPEGKGRTS